MNILRCRAIQVLGFLVVVLLSACGGGGGGGDNNPTPPVPGVGAPPLATGSSTWDQMIWDQDNWG